MNIKNLLIKLRPFTLLIAIVSGFIVFLMFHYIKALSPLKPVAYVVSDCLPGVLFVILFCAFIKIEYKQMKPHVWHYVLIAFQVLASLFFALYVHLNDLSVFAQTILLGLVVCIITPTAASASVITGKLGGNESALTTYIILSNLAAAIGIPLIFPLISTTTDIPFSTEFVAILNKVFPMIVLPLIAAIIIKLFFNRLHKFFVAHTKDLGFYLWACIIFVLSAKTFTNIFASQSSSMQIIIFAVTGLLCTIFQFSFGKIVGHIGKQRISAGQGLGQKNMLFGIWVALTYLNPTVAIIPGTYILWQNSMNAWQMWYRERSLVKWKQMGVEPYQE